MLVGKFELNPNKETDLGETRALLSPLPDYPLTAKASGVLLSTH